MPFGAGSRLVGALVALLLASIGTAWIVAAGIARHRDAFETDARIAHRLLSQRAVQNDAILATLALLQPGGTDGPATRPEQRLPALYPQVLAVASRGRDAQWPTASLQEADEASRRLGRALLAEANLPSGRYTLVRAADPSSYALRIDASRLAEDGEWPLSFDAPVRLALHLGDQAYLVNAGGNSGSAGGGFWQFDFRKRLASDSQPFEMVATRTLRWAEAPWAAIGMWWLAIAAAWASMQAWRRQRAARRRAEELLRLGQLGRLNALGELAAGLAHELNQPLTALMAGTQAARRLLAEDPPDLDTASAAMAQAVQQARRAGDVVGRLRRMIQRPDASAQPEALSLPHLVREVMHLLEPECARRGVTVRWRLAAEPLFVLADRVALEQIVHNLVMNALQAMERVPTGRRELALEVAPEREGRGDRTAVLRVLDTGPGIPAEALGRVFEPFFTTREGGLGLGLSLCETLATGMGGSLVCMAEPRSGAEFRLSLPAVDAPEGAR
ncbi:sensor histidine kinase [Zeimonas arvi]|uniref:histidine kinase n=1 Tax=Zeimonas arvi TaxID=2498847 RepID=A0A5C8NUB2_9BURK|nr:ATP-binding protein [Zeimonas arvi]TXL64751.1 two-component sensor histidine kinase [Zeimonas arvi]